MSSDREGFARPAAPTAEVIRRLCEPAVFLRGEEYAHAGRISKTWQQEDGLIGGRCRGSEPISYTVTVAIEHGQPVAASCDCPHELAYCKHVVALLLTYTTSPDSFAQRPNPIRQLLQRPTAEIERVLQSLAREWPPFTDWLAGQLDLRQATPPVMAPSVDATAFRRRVSRLIRGLDASDSYWQAQGVTEQLRELMRDASDRVYAGDHRNGLELLLVLAEAGADAFDALDDSDGYLGEFVADLAEELAAVLTVMELVPAERRELARRLEDLGQEVAEYGIDDGFDDAVLVVLAGIPGGEQSLGGAERDRLLNARLRGLEASGKQAEYLDLCLRSNRRLDYAAALIRYGRLAEALPVALDVADSQQTSLLLAQAFAEAGDRTAAVTVGSRGLHLPGDNIHLSGWLGPVAEEAGQLAIALEAYRMACTSAPELDRYAAIRRLAGDAWEAERSTLLVAARRARAVDILLYETLWDEAIAVADGSGPYGYPTVERVVIAAGAARPEWAVAACKRQVELIIAPVDSKRYPLVGRWLEHMARILVAVDRAPEWNAYLRGFREQYRRRPALLAAIKHFSEVDP